MVSIIIPVFNREFLVGETLNSIMQQSYNNWECIIVDDDSDDDTLQILERFARVDSRIKFFKRPEKRPKGANACRNYGFEKSSGESIIWFDSDDLMTKDHVLEKVQALKSSEVDFVVARTQNFQNRKMLEPYHYQQMQNGIKASDFILLKIHWYTYDVILKREIAQKISWNEEMKSWQDYNYFCKMLLITERGKYLDVILTHRRIHSDSIQKYLTKDRTTFKKELLENRLLTYLDISSEIDRNTEKELVFGIMNLAFDISTAKDDIPELLQVERVVHSSLGKRAALFFNLALCSGRFLQKGHYFLNKAKNR